MKCTLEFLTGEKTWRNVQVPVSLSRNGNNVAKYDGKIYVYKTMKEGETPYYTAMEGQPSKLVKKVSYLKRVYRVKAPVCEFCKIALEKETIKSPCDRLRVMSIKVGLVHRMFGGWLN
jgi:hypothetical protein